MKRIDFGITKLVASAICAGLMLSPMAVRATSSPAAAALHANGDSLSDADVQWMDELNDDGELDSPYTWPSSRVVATDAKVARAVQYLLRAHGYSLVVDGKWGAQTKARLKQFQAKAKKSGRGDGHDYIEADGTLDQYDWTWEELVVPLRRNSKNANAVRAAQSLLRAKGYKIALDGKFGPQMHAAVRRYQDAHDLTIDGIIGKETWCVLLGGKFTDFDDPNGAVRE